MRGGKLFAPFRPFAPIALETDICRLASHSFKSISNLGRQFKSLNAAVPAATTSSYYLRPASRQDDARLADKNKIFLVSAYMLASEPRLGKKRKRSRQLYFCGIRRTRCNAIQSSRLYLVELTIVHAGSSKPSLHTGNSEAFRVFGMSRELPQAKR